MKKIIAIISLLALIIIATTATIAFAKRTSTRRATPKKTTNITKSTLTKPTMQITSPAFAANQAIPSTYTCDGKNISPPLDITGIPPNTKSLALIVDDPDAPGGDWVHWLVWNIAPAGAAQNGTQHIAENKTPPGATTGTTDFGTTGYGGPCPPSGTHRYHFKLYAIDAQLTLPATTKKPQLEAAIKPHTIAQATMMGQYKRTK